MDTDSVPRPAAFMPAVRKNTCKNGAPCGACAVFFIREGPYGDPAGRPAFSFIMPFVQAYSPGPARFLCRMHRKARAPAGARAFLYFLLFFAAARPQPKGW